jgi:hypothetical protein
MLFTAAAGRRAALVCLLSALFGVAGGRQCDAIDCGEPVCGLAEACGDCCTGACKGNGCDRYWLRGEYL